MNILVTGGAGYIGSHTCIELLNAGHEVVVVDNFSTSNRKSLERVQEITGRQLLVVDADICNEQEVRKALTNNACEGVIHFAGLKSVGESSKNPLQYYGNNLIGTLTLLKAMKDASIKKIVFSSSATVYGEPQYLPLNEVHPLSVTNPYGRTKLIIEEILRDLFLSDAEWSIFLLRYFNPVGAHESGLIGEDPRGIPNNLMPFVAQVAIGKRESLNIWGNDYLTHDGTGVRDYVHVVDLAVGHIKALEKLTLPQCTAINLGTGTGYSVMDVIKEFEKTADKKIPYHLSPRRTGDVASCYADATLAKTLLNWKAERNLTSMCQDHWRWQEQNPMGYL